MQLDEQTRPNESRSCQHLHQYAGNCHGHALIRWYLAVSTKQVTPFRGGINISCIYHTIPLVKKCAHRQVEQLKGLEFIFPISHNNISFKKTCLYSDLQVSEQEVPQVRDYTDSWNENWGAADQWWNLSRWIRSLSTWPSILVCLQSQHKIEVMTLSDAGVFHLGFHNTYGSFSALKFKIT